MFFRLKHRCQDASRLLLEQADHALPRHQRWLLRIHLWLCARCRQFERQNATLDAALKQWRAQQQT